MTKLSSDVLEQQFGRTTVEIIEQSARHRVIYTRAEDGTVLEVSFVLFNDTKTYPTIHKAIKNGASIGKAFRNRNVPFTRHDRIIAKMPTHGVFREIFNHVGDMTFIEVDILAGKEKTHYATIRELYNPIVQWPQESTHDERAAYESLARVARAMAASL